MRTYIPSGNAKIPFDIDASRVVTSKISMLPSVPSGRKAVENALRNPIGSPRLCELAKDAKTCVILISDHTRPVPSRDILPPMLAELRTGNPSIKITLLVATGCHRATTKEELHAKLGDEIFDRETIVVHDCDDTANLTNIGILPSGAPLIVNSLAVNCDLLVSEGFIEPHFFAGFSGGRKSVLPGICDRKTVLGNHCGAFIASPFARTGVLQNNPIHRDMEAAAELAHLRFIVNVVIDENKRTAAAFAGDFRAAHAAGVSFLRKFCEVPAVKGDIVITSNGGAPLDQNLYQCVKGLTAAEACAKENATLILCADMADGAGGDNFYRQLKDCDSPAALFTQFCETPQSETQPDQWQSQILCRILMRHRVIFVTRPEMRKTIREMKMEYAETLEKALEMAGSGEITVIPDGVSVMIK